MSTRQALERVTASGIVLPPRQNADAQWPIVQLTTDVPGLTFNVAIDHETEQGEREWRDLWNRITSAQQCFDVDPSMGYGAIELVTPHDGTVYRLTRRGVRSITGVCEAYAQYVDSIASRPGQVKFRSRPDAAAVNGKPA